MLRISSFSLRQKLDLFNFTAEYLKNISKLCNYRTNLQTTTPRLSFLLVNLSACTGGIFHVYLSCAPLASEFIEENNCLRNNLFDD